MNNRSWKSYLFEMVTIIMGITIPFLLNEWRIQQSNQKQEVQILTDIHENLVTDSLLLTEEIQVLGTCTRSCDKLLTAQSFAELGDSAFFFLAFAQMYSTMPFNDIAYKALEQTGESKLISNKKLLADIITNYEKDYFTIKEYNDIDKQLILTRFIPYIEANIEYDPPIVHSGSEALKATHFRNITRNNQLFKKIQINLYQEQLKKLRLLIGQLEEELGRK